MILGFDMSTQSCKALVYDPERTSSFEMRRCIRLRS